MRRTKEEKQRIKENKKLVKEFPFLLPRNRFSGEVSKDYDYTYTELDSMPNGWRNKFGLQMCKEIKDELVKYNYLDDYRIMDIKEKYGILCWYDWGQPAKSRIDEIISKYEDLSMCYCINCGQPVRYISRGWIEYLCEDCAKKKGLNYCERLSKEYIPSRQYYFDGELIQLEQTIDFYKMWDLPIDNKENN